MLAALASAALLQAKDYVVASPDGNVVVTVSAAEKVSYTVDRAGIRLLDPSFISMTLQDGTVFGGKEKFRASSRSVDVTVPAQNFKRASVRDHFNELTLSAKRYDIVFRAYDDGVAYRFVAKGKKGETVVTAEQAEFAFPADWNLYVPYVARDFTSFEPQFFNSFENTYAHHALSAWEKGRLAFLPLTVEAAGGIKLCVTESDLLDYPGMYLYNGNASKTLTGVFAAYPDVIEQGGHNMLQGLVRSRKDFIAKGPAEWAFPWRTVIIATEDRQLAESDMTWRLARPAAAGDWSWVNPGKVAWDWWNDWNVYGVDFEAGINNDTYKHYIDFASEHGIEYVILDEGWAVNLQADLMQVIPEIDLPMLCRYAESKQVGLILWAGYWAFNRDMEGVCRHYAEMGVKGWKVDFMDRDDQPMVQFYEKAAATAAKYQMTVDFHGAFKPAGIQRTYPNGVNFEGIRGLEQMKWLEDGAQQVVYDVTIPFIRMLAGPMDYTQGAMRNATARNYHPVNSEPMSPGTRCRQLAEYVIFDAPFTMLCDSPSNYLQEPECTKYIAEIPTVWDETLVLNGKIGQFITMARRSGDTWYVGSMTDWTPRDMTVELGFLPAGRYSVEIFKDGANAHRAARDYAKEEAVVNPGDRLKVHLAPGGGWVAKIVKQ